MEFFADRQNKGQLLPVSTVCPLVYHYHIFSHDKLELLKENAGRHLHPSAKSELRCLTHLRVQTSIFSIL